MSGDDTGSRAVGVPTSGASGGQARYDAAELRGRMAACLSLKDMRRLAEDLGTPGIALDRGVAEAARDLVRVAERQGALPTLVAALKRAQPLVEWPEPLPASEPAPEPEPASAPAPAPAPAPASAPAPAPAPASASEPAPASASASASAPASASASAPAPAPPIQDPFQAGSAGWPGTEDVRPPAPSRGLDPRILVVVAALMVAAVGLAYLAGRVSTGPEAASAGAESAAPARQDSVAARASAAIARRAEVVARTCEIGSGAPGEVIRRAFLQCGPEAAAAATRPGRPPAGDAATAAPTARERPSPAPEPTRPRPVPPPPPAPADPGSGCLRGCDREHQQCKASQCGSEPTQSSQYKAYQDCLSTCLRAASRCRLACQ